MKSLIPHREHFDKPERLSPAWTLTKGVAAAECTVWSHEFGFELRLVVTGDAFARTQVVCTQLDLIQVQEEWRAALEVKGWMRAPT
jgi:hypothetical protein